MVGIRIRYGSVRDVYEGRGKGDLRYNMQMLVQPGAAKKMVEVFPLDCQSRRSEIIRSAFIFWHTFTLCGCIPRQVFKCDAIFDTRCP